MDGWDASVKRHYDEGLGYELARLEKHSPVELGMTLRALERWAPRCGVAIDVGVYRGWAGSSPVRLAG